MKKPKEKYGICCRCKEQGYQTLRAIEETYDRKKWFYPRWACESCRISLRGYFRYVKP